MQKPTANRAAALVMFLATLATLIFMDQVRLMVIAGKLFSLGYEPIHEATKVVMMLKFTIYILAFGFIVFLLFLKRKSGLFVPFFISIIVAYFAALAVASAPGYYGNYFGFLFPLHIALALLFIRHWTHANANSVVVWPVVLLSVFTVFLIRNPPPSKTYLASRMEQSLRVQSTSLSLDRLLENCAMREYFNFGDFEPIALSTYTPLGPFVTFDFSTYVPFSHPLRTFTIKNIVENAELLLFANDASSASEALTRKAEKYTLPLAELENRFTETVPECAKTSLPIPGFHVLFRKQV